MLRRTVPVLARQPWRRPTSVAPFLRVPAQRRWASSQEPSSHVAFYKTFGRPMLKVFLMAVFTYQLAYWAWAKLEADEITAERQAEISALEAQVKELQSASSKP